MEQYNYIRVLSRFDFYDVRFKKFSLYYDDDDTHTLDITTCDSFDWGMPSPLAMRSPETFPPPSRMELRWVTVNEGKCFEITASLEQDKAEALWKQQMQDFPDDPFRQYVIGVGPYGGVAVWLCSNAKSVLLHWLMAEETSLTDEELEMHTPEPEMEEFIDMLLPKRQLQSDMRQYRYRFVPLEEFFDGKQWRRYDSSNIIYEEIALDGVEVKRLDGSFDYTHCDEMMRYHEFGKPHRITVKWKEGEASFIAHFWLDKNEITFFFDSFFKAFPEAQADLLLRLDTKANRYEVSLTGEGLPVRALRETQYIVFKDNADYARSDYFDKKDGAWRWN